MSDIPLGDLKFKHIALDDHYVGRALADFVVCGAGSTRLTSDNLHIIRRDSSETGAFTDVAKAIASGTRLFDAIAYFSIPNDRRPLPVHEPLDPGHRDPTIDEIGAAIYFVYLYLLVRGSAPPSTAGSDTVVIPKFLSNIMALKEEAHVYAQRVASFDLSLLEHGWIKHIPVKRLDTKTRNRLSLGVAGYRIPSVLTFGPYRQDANPEALRVTRVVVKFLEKGATWDVQSVTRSGAFSDTVKNFNQNCGNLLCEVYTTEQLKDFKKLGILFRLPEIDPRFTNWRTWDDDTFASFTDYIVREDN